MQYTLREQLNILRASLVLERTSFEPVWSDCGRYILPKRPRFFVSESNRGERKDEAIIDSTATLAHRTLRSGMMSGITSPARPWFRLTTRDPQLAESSEVKNFLDQVTAIMRSIFLKSNFYNSLPIIYGDLGVFGTAALFIEESMDDVLITQPFAIGSYYISTNEKLKVDVFHREFRMSVRNIITKFGFKEVQGKGEIQWDRFSSRIKEMYDRGDIEQYITVCHTIMPNHEHNPLSKNVNNKKYISAYYELGTGIKQSSNYLDSIDEDKYLSLSGYDLFPVLCPRWEVNGEDVYSTSWPGLDCLGDIKQLQLGEKKILTAINKIVDPPLKGSSSLRAQKVGILPGDISYDDQGTLSPIYQIDSRIMELENKQNQVRHRIQKGFYEDLFLMLDNLNDRQRTATEIAERHEEKLLALGPVLEQLNQDLLDPLIEITFSYMYKQGKLPDIPEALQGQDLKVEYISIMAQAQKLAGLGSIDRFSQYVYGLAQVYPDAILKINPDKMINHYAEITGIPNEILRTDDEVEMLRQQQQQAQSQQMQAQNLKDMTTGVKNLSASKLGENSALDQLLLQSQAGQMVAQ